MTIRIPLNIPLFLFAVMLGLKLVGAISWPWWLITLPIWFPFAVMAMFGVLALLAMALICALTLLVGLVALVAD